MAELSTVTLSLDERDRPMITVSYRDAAEVDNSVDTGEWLVSFAERLTDKSASFLRKLVELTGDANHISFGDLATELSVEKREVDGWNRNLGRSVKAVVRDLGFLRPDAEDGTAQVFDYEWDKDENIWRYAVPEKYRAILLKALDDR